MANWVITLTFDVEPSMETLDRWAQSLSDLDASVARIPGHGVDVTVYTSGDIGLWDAAVKVAGGIAHVVQAEPIGAEVLDEEEYARRAEAPSMPELMSAAEIAEELGVSRQRVHQLRETTGFPTPLADLRGGAVWDAAAIRKFDREWSRKPGRPKLTAGDEKLDSAAGWH